MVLVGKVTGGIGGGLFSSSPGAEMTEEEELAPSGLPGGQEGQAQAVATSWDMGDPPLRDARPNPRDLGDSCPMRVPGTAWDFPGGCAIKGTFAAGARAPGHFLPSLTPRGQAPALWPRSFLLRQGGFHPA